MEANMRIAVVIVGLIVGAVLFYQSYLASGAPASSWAGTVGAISTTGLAVAALWLAGCLVAYPAPQIGFVAFAAAAVVAFISTPNVVEKVTRDVANLPPLAYWGAAALVLAL